MSDQITIPTPGDLVAEKFRIERELGRGAYGVVFLATQKGIDRKVAVKTLLPKAFFEEGIVERFEREAKFVGRLNHPNIVRVFDYGRHEELLYMAVEYVDGFSLEEIIESDAPLEPERTRQLVYQMLDGLAHAHDRGVIHRDLKPGNILILREEQPDGTAREVVKILDFGIAKLIQSESDKESQQTLTQAGTVLGTPHYMSPESIVGEDVDHTVDLYAIGVMIYEMLTGRRPFTAKNSPSVMVRHLRDDPPPLPPHLEDSCWGEAVRKCMEKQPKFRLQSTQEIRDLLERRDESEPPDWWKDAAPTEQLAHLETMQRERARTTQQSGDEPGMSNRGRAIAAVLAGVLVGAVVAVAFWMGRDTQRPETDPDSRAVASVESAEDDGDQRLPDIPEGPSMAAEPSGARGDAGDDAASGTEATEMTFGPEDDDLPGSTESDEGDSNEDARRGEEPSAAPDNASPKKAQPDSNRPSEKQRPRKKPSKPEKITLQMVSTPEGARVKLDGRPVGTTPTDVEVDRSEKRVEVIFSHIGYQPQTKHITLDRDHTVEVRLEKGRLKLIP